VAEPGDRFAVLRERAEAAYAAAILARSRRDVSSRDEVARG